ncbi:hypothetical protein BV898_19545 [Hypsibius exemplaris]|uniref:Uncharacterized protein n=1 Tax=Hypsibius exemplaris TaxID=2072580 RepID=A0A9X6RP80_HYPEX|nr:hypothetical protein BV898_19545 [Hypsibius exemplaris]
MFARPWLEPRCDWTLADVTGGGGGGGAEAQSSDCEAASMDGLSSGFCDACLAVLSSVLLLAGVLHVFLCASFLRLNQVRMLWVLPDWTRSSWDTPAGCGDHMLVAVTVAVVVVYVSLRPLAPLC